MSREPILWFTGLDLYVDTSGSETGEEQSVAITQPRTPAGTAPADFATFYRHAWPGAVRLSALLIQDARVAEDIAQEAFTRVFPKWERVENPSAYLRTAIVNTCRSWQSRRHTERVKLPLIAAAGSTEFQFDALADAVGALPYRQRAALVLRYYAGLSEAEIADALDCRPGTVKSLTARALAVLRKGIEE